MADGIRAAAFDPGNVRTGFGAENNDVLTRLLYRTPLSKLVLISPEKGGSNLAFFLNGRPGTDWRAGRFYAQTTPASRRRTNSQVFDDARSRSLAPRVRAAERLTDQSRTAWCEHAL
jgi:hypothetical protein